MSKKIFINLPVSDLPKSMAFYSSIGFTNNAQFTDETASCMILSEEIYVMLLTHSKFSEFTQKTISDTTQNASVINAISVDSEEEVNTMLESAIKAGANEHKEAQDYGFMQLRSFEDLDGHLWEVFFMDETKFAG
jgi:uncharacterized protein